MWMLPVTLLILGLTSGVYMETCPREEDIYPCDCEEDERGDIKVTCSGTIVNVKSLREVLHTLSGKNDIDLIVSDAELGKLSSDFFNGVGIKRLELTRSYLDSLSNDNETGLLGLENHLEELMIVGSFLEENTPAKLNLGHLKKLRKLDLSLNTITELSDDWFSNGPSSLEILIVSNNFIEKIGENAFSSLSNMKQLSLNGNRFGPIMRSMFPTTADRLKQIELNNNALSDIPEDLFSGMSSISSISLRGNAISILKESTWSPIWQQLEKLRLEGNFMYCDDRLNWILKSERRPSVGGKCYAPKKFEGHTLKEFFECRSE